MPDPAPTPAPAPAPSPAAAAPAPATIAAPGPSDPPAPAAAPSPAPAPGNDPKPGDPPKAIAFPDNWRDELAGGDEKFMAALKRYASPKAFAEGFWNLRRRMDAGEFKRPLGENPTEAEVKQYREENGIPEVATAYKLPDGLKISDIDKPIIDGFMQFAHIENMPQAQVGKMVDWYYRAQAQANEQMAQADAERHQMNDDTIRGEWGRDYRTNVQAINNFLDGSAPKGLKDRLLGARLADGALLGDDPEALRWLAQLGRATNPLASLVGAGGGGSAATAEARLGELNALMADRESKYWKGPDAEKLQAEWREIRSALDKAKAASKKF